MDSWRVTLLVTVGIFVIFLFAKLRPRMPEDDGDVDDDDDVDE